MTCQHPPCSNSHCIPVCAPQQQGAAMTSWPCWPQHSTTHSGHTCMTPGSSAVPTKFCPRPESLQLASSRCPCRRCGRCPPSSATSPGSSWLLCQSASWPAAQATRLVLIYILVRHDVFVEGPRMTQMQQGMSTMATGSEGPGLLSSSWGAR
jgi:hypothetical protein